MSKTTDNTPSMPDAAGVTSELVNGWIQETFSEGLPITISINRLSLRIVSALEQAFQRGYAAGVKDESGNAGKT